MVLYVKRSAPKVEAVDGWWVTELGDVQVEARGVDVLHPAVPLEEVTPQPYVAAKSIVIGCM
jgi:hypothetical protein